MAASLAAKPGKVIRLTQCPSDVLELVISFLPVPDMFRLRTVCKQWNEIITTRAFQENGQLRFNKLQLLAVCNTDSAGSDKPEFKAYDVETQKWHSFDLSFLPGNGTFRVLDFAGCLACVMHKKHMERVLYVCNPLTKSFARLPSPPRTKSFNPSSSPNVIVRMYYCRKTGHYKVFVVSGFRVKLDHTLSWMFNRLDVEKFDSSSWKWSVHAQICQPPFMWWEMMGAAVLPCKDQKGTASLFILRYESLGHNPHGRQVFALLFDEEKGDLGFVEIKAALPRNLLNPRLVCSERNPRPLLVSAVGDGNYGVTGVGIWELDDKLSEWRMLTVMPDDFCKYLRSLKEQVGKHEGTMVVVGLEQLPRCCLGHIPAIAVGVAYKHLIYIHPQDVVAWTIVFDMRTLSWHLLPPQITTTTISPVITVSTCVRECAFEPSLENVVSAHGPN